MSTAGWRYLEEVVSRLDHAAGHLLAMTACGPSAAAELADVAATDTVRRVLLPSSVDRLEPGLAGLLTLRLGARAHRIGVLARRLRLYAASIASEGAP